MGRNWAITIGINGYRYLQRLNYAKGDADAVRQLFLKELGFQQVYHFTDDSPDIRQDHGPDLESRPTATTLGRFLRTRFEKPFLRDGDNLWFFFAGHGIRSENRDYLMPLDGDREDLVRSAISIHYISERLRRSGADNVILLIDACRSFDEGRRDGFGIGQENQQGVITLFSCSPEESSYEIAELRQGAFTYVLLESLRRQGEGNCATVERLYQQLRYYVPQIARQYKRVSQTPYGVIEPPTKNHLILLPQIATLSDIVTLKKDALRAEVQQDRQGAKRCWVRVLAASPADPEAIEGIERLSRQRLTPPPSSPPESKPINSPPAKSRAAAPSVPTSAKARSVAPPQSQPRRRAINPPRSRSSAGLPISRRRAIQLLSFTGGGVGILLTGRAIQQSLPDDSIPPLTSADFVPFEFEVVTVNETGEEVSRETKQGQEFREAINNTVLEMVAIPGGTFTMGSPENEAPRADNEGPQREVTVPQFLMGKYQVTQAQWKAVAALPKVSRDLDADPARFKGDNRPVEGVSWDDATEFCARLSQHTGRPYRLPSESEWEYACRANTTTPFHFGEVITPELANYNGNFAFGDGPTGEFREETTEVGSFPANAFGLYDMHGNVFEWCLDTWHENYEGAPSDGSAWISSDERENRRVLRGGSWDYFPVDCRSAGRGRYAPDDRSYNTGFRVVCVLART